MITDAQRQEAIERAHGVRERLGTPRPATPPMVWECSDCDAVEADWDANPRLPRRCLQCFEKSTEQDYEMCDLCSDRAFQIVADATRDPVEYRYRCRAHMDPEGPFPTDQQKGLE